MPDKETYSMSNRIVVILNSDMEISYGANISKVYLNSYLTKEFVVRPSFVLGPAQSLWVTFANDSDKALKTEPTLLAYRQKDTIEGTREVTNNSASVSHIEQIPNTGAEYFLQIPQAVLSVPGTWYFSLEVREYPDENSEEYELIATTTSGKGHFIVNNSLSSGGSSAPTNLDILSLYKTLVAAKNVPLVSKLIVDVSEPWSEEYSWTAAVSCFNRTPTIGEKFLSFLSVKDTLFFVISTITEFTEDASSVSATVNAVYPSYEFILSLLAGKASLNEANTFTQKNVFGDDNNYLSILNNTLASYFKRDEGDNTKVQLCGENDGIDITRNKNGKTQSVGVRSYGLVVSDGVKRSELTLPNNGNGTLATQEEMNETIGNISDKASLSKSNIFTEKNTFGTDDYSTTINKGEVTQYQSLDDGGYERTQAAPNYVILSRHERGENADSSTLTATAQGLMWRRLPSQAYPGLTQVKVQLPDRVSGENFVAIVLLPSKSGTLATMDDLFDALLPIEEKIPSQASPTNQLADKDFVNSSINSVTAYYISYNAAGDAFPTKSALDSATQFYFAGALRTPTKNDYCVVLNDESRNNSTVRYVYQGDDGKGVWAFQYVVNETPLTAAQLAALNSGVTADAVEQIQELSKTIEEKADKDDAASLFENNLFHNGQRIEGKVTLEEYDEDGENRPGTLELKIGDKTTVLTLDPSKEAGAKIYLPSKNGTLATLDDISSDTSGGGSIPIIDLRGQQ